MKAAPNKRDERNQPTPTQILLEWIAGRNTLIANRLAKMLVCFPDSGSRAIATELHEDESSNRPSSSTSAKE